MKFFKNITKHLRKGFTLIEILIVIAIIGLLTVALLPRIQGAQASARNTARKADLNQIATALAAYNGDFGQYPEKLDALAGSNGYLKSLPKDPAGNKKICTSTAVGEYFYTRAGDGYILTAYMEKQAGNPSVNFVGDTCPTKESQLCGRNESAQCDTTKSDQLRYVIRVDN